MHALVIGASRGIGREFVRQYLDAGWQVDAAARRQADVDDLAALGAGAFALDVADAASASAVGWRVDGAAYDAVVVNASAYGPRTDALEPPSQADFDRVMHTNVLGPMRVLPQLAEALAPRARVAVLSSLAGSIGARGTPADWLYAASKAALNSVLKDLSLALGERAICVAFHPGWVRADAAGAPADLTPQRSVADMRRTLDALTPERTGSFLSHDGRTIPW